jgi:hypothetical protein
MSAELPIACSLNATDLPTRLAEKSRRSVATL